jgi:hypothetical protein
MKQKLMQIQQVINTLIAPKDPTLHELTNDLIHESAALAILNRNYIVNNIPADLRIATNGVLVSSVLDKLLYTVFRHAHNSVILISARVYGMTILVQVKSKGTISPGLPEEIGHASLKAKNSGGIIEMIQCETGHASVAYCFLNESGAA